MYKPYPEKNQLWGICIADTLHVRTNQTISSIVVIQVIEVKIIQKP